MLRYLTAGESHGPSLTAILEGIPAGLALSPKDIDVELSRRQLGYGRGGRMKIEQDRAVITGGVRHGYTLGATLALTIANRDFSNWQDTMAPDAEAKARDTRPSVTRPRPGHADLSGAIKYGHRDVRNVLERASARETTARVAGGAGERGGAPPQDNPRRDFRGHRGGGARRPGELHPVGPEAGWPPGAGTDEHPGDQGGGGWSRLRSGAPLWVRGARRDLLRRAATGTARG